MLKQWTEGPNNRLNKIVYHTGKEELPVDGDKMVIEISEGDRVLFYQTARAVKLMRTHVFFQHGGDVATHIVTDRCYHKRPVFETFEEAKATI